jgi:hypothetical protein
MGLAALARRLHPISRPSHNGCLFCGWGGGRIEFGSRNTPFLPVGRMRPPPLRSVDCCRRPTLLYQDSVDSDLEFKRSARSWLPQQRLPYFGLGLKGEISDSEWVNRPEMNACLWRCSLLSIDGLRGCCVAHYV